MLKENDRKSRIKQCIILLAIGIAVNAVLAGVKMYVGTSTNSLTIMLDATNSFFDVLTSVVTLIAFAVLFIPRGEGAPFGYGRSEYLAGFVVAVVSAVVGGLFFMRSLNRLAMPEPVWYGWQSCVLIAVTIPIKIALATVYYLRNKKLRSKAISAIALDCCLDVGITGASLVSFAVSSRIDYAADAIFGIVISIVVLIFAVKMIADNIRSVVKGDGAHEELEAVKKVVSGDARIKRVGNVVLHDYGFGAKVGTVEATFGESADLKDVERAEVELYLKIKEECGAEVRIVPLDEKSLKDEIEYKRFLPKNRNKQDKSANKAEVDRGS